MASLSGALPWGLWTALLPGNAALQNITCRRMTDRLHCASQQCGYAALSAFLDVSSLNLAAPRAPPFFCLAAGPPPSIGEQSGRLPGEAGDEPAHVGPHGGEAGQALDAGLVHVELAADL